MILNDKNFTMYAMQNYDNPSCMGVEEFEEDVSRIRSVYRLMAKYRRTGELKERLILNHLRIMYNVFNHVALTKMLCLKLKKYIDVLKPFLILLSYWPERIVGVDGIDIVGVDVPMDSRVVSVLRSL